jgi:hypothetical protein
MQEDLTWVRRGKTKFRHAGIFFLASWQMAPHREAVFPHTNRRRASSVPRHGLEARATLLASHFSCF